MRPPALLNPGDPSGGASAHAERVTFRRIRQQDGDDRAGADDQQREHEERIGEHTEAVAVAQQQADQPKRRDPIDEDQHALGAPAAVEPGDDGDGGDGDEGGAGDERAGDAHAAAFRDQTSGKPEHHAEVDESPGERGQRKSGGNAEEVADADRRRRGRGRRRGVSQRRRGWKLMPKRASVSRASSMRPMLCRKRADSCRTGLTAIRISAMGMIDEPHDAPAEVRLQDGGERAGGEVAAHRADAADEYKAPAAMARGHDFREQRVGDRQHAAGADAHQEAHEDVPVEGGHGSADGSAHEDDAGEQDGGAASVEVGERTPEKRADGGSGEAGEGHERDVCEGDVVLDAHARDDEAERRGLHDVDDEGDGEQDDLNPVGAR